MGNVTICCVIYPFNYRLDSTSTILITDMTTIKPQTNPDDPQGRFIRKYFVTHSCQIFEQ